MIGNRVADVGCYVMKNAKLIGPCGLVVGLWPRGPEFEPRCYIKGCPAVLPKAKQARLELDVIIKILDHCLATYEFKYRCHIIGCLGVQPEEKQPQEMGFKNPRTLLSNL